MYPPDALVRFSRRFLVRSVRPGREKAFKGLTVFWAFYIPLMVVLLVLLSSLGGQPLVQKLPPAISLLIGVTFFCGQSAVLAERSKPLLSSRLSVAALAAWVLVVVAFGLLVYLLLRPF